MAAAIIRRSAEKKKCERGPSQNFRTLFLSFIDPFSYGVGSLMLLGALKHELGIFGMIIRNMSLFSGKK